MHSKVRSGLHLMTGSAPRARVESHRQSPAQSRELRIGDSHFTNDFLRKGGSLPPVLPADDCTGERTDHTKYQNRLNGAKCNSDRLRSKCIVTVNRKRTDASNRKHLLIEPTNRPEASMLEKKIEHLSTKLSEVHDVLQNHVTDVVTQPQQIHASIKSEHFSAHDYVFLLLELNSNIPAQPYNPADFSENHIR